MRTIKELYTLKGKVYLRLESSQAYHHFARAAAAEGFRLPRGEDDILALNADWSFSHPGFVGHAAFYHAKPAAGVPLLRVDYTRWIAGADDYLYTGSGKGGDPDVWAGAYQSDLDRV